MIKVGSKIVAIVHFHQVTRTHPGHIVPIKGEIYTVRDILKTSYATGVYLKEIVNAPYQFNDGFNEMAWNIVYFWEVDEMFAENLLNEISEEVEQEELVTI